MGHLKLTLNNFLKLLKSEALLISLAVGIILAWVFRESVSNLFFGVGFDIRRPIVQLPVWAFFSVLFTLLVLGVYALLNKLLPKKIWTVIYGWLKVKGFDAQNQDQRLFLAIIIIGIGVIGIFLVNNILSMIHPSDWTFSPVNPIPVIQPVGFDFRIGSYETASTLLSSNFKQIRDDGTYSSIYPPLVSLLNLPYLLVNENTAYLIHLVLLIFSNILCLIIVASLAKKFLSETLGVKNNFINAALVFLVFMLVLYMLSSYGFFFSIERGNTDIFALVLSLLAMWVLVNKPESLWLQVILLSIATHLKIYPAVLFFLLLYKHGKKLIIPALIVNLGFLFILGPKMAYAFISTITSSSGVGAGFGNRWPWIGNHAAYSFAVLLAPETEKYNTIVMILWGIFSIIPFALWGVAARKLLHKKFTTEEAFLFTMVSIPLMDLIPTVSMDYKLVILCSAALMILIVLIKQILLSANPINFIQLALVILIMFFIGRGYDMNIESPYLLRDTASLLINNKYLWSLALQFIMVWNIIKNHKRIQVEQS